MVTRAIFTNAFGNKNEQNLLDSLMVESIQVSGLNFYYIPRQVQNFDDVLNEDTVSTYTKSYLLEMYLQNVDGFNGQGDFLSKFGMEIRDSFTVVVARKVFQEKVPQVRPNEGDIIYCPLNKKIFVVRFVEHEKPFYALNKLYTWDINLELFEYSGETIDTGIAEVDAIGHRLSIDSKNFNILTEDGLYLTDETGAPIIQEFKLQDKEVTAQNDIFTEKATSFVNFLDDPMGDLSP